jgi:hypothetical protein
MRNKNGSTNGIRTKNLHRDKKDCANRLYIKKSKEGLSFSASFDKNYHDF